jgi:bacterioferritin-associated ferredoxin
MYVCVCNAYRESHVREAINKSPQVPSLTVEQIYDRLGRKPQCGRCLTYVKSLIETSRTKQVATSRV